MLLTVVVGIAFIGLAMLGLAVGVIFKKRTPLKGACGSAVTRSSGNDTCESCNCHGDGEVQAVQIQ